MVDVGRTTRLWVAYNVKATGLTWTLHGAALAESFTQELTVSTVECWL